MSKMRLVLVERLEPDQAVRCVLCNPTPEIPAERYRFVLEDENGERSDYCYPCAKTLLDKLEPALIPAPEDRRRKIEIFKPPRFIRSILHS